MDLYIVEIFLMEIVHYHIVSKNRVLDIEMIHYHEVSKAVVLYRHKVNLPFLNNMFQPMDKKLIFSVAYHSKYVGPVERVNQVLDDMLWVHVVNI